MTERERDVACGSFFFVWREPKHYAMLIGDAALPFGLRPGANAPTDSVRVL